MKAHKRNILQEPSVSVLSLVSLSNTKNERDEELDKHKPFLPANRVLDICLYFLVEILPTCRVGKCKYKLHLFQTWMLNKLIKRPSHLPITYILISVICQDLVIGA